MLWTAGKQQQVSQCWPAFSMKGHKTMVQDERDSPLLNADHAHDSERTHQLDTLAAEASNDLGLDAGAARVWAQAELDRLLAFAAWWDQHAEDGKNGRKVVI
jgi:hypothetical protein